jgi:TIR domain
LIIFSGKTCKCYLSYAWPVRKDEVDLLERVLRLHDYLLRSGVDILFDLVTGNSFTPFETTLLDWIQKCDIALLLGSSTYTDSTTHPQGSESTHREEEEGDSVIPVIMAGEARNALPPGYTTVMGGDLRQSLRYFAEVAALAAKLLDIQHDPEVTPPSIQ